MYMFRHIGSPVEHCMDIAYCLCIYIQKIIEGYCNALAIVEQCMFEPKWNPAFSFSTVFQSAYWLVRVNRYVTDCRGTFRMERQDRKMFEVHIPAFSLESHLQGSPSSPTTSNQPPPPTDITV